MYDDYEPRGFARHRPFALQPECLGAAVTSVASERRRQASLGKVERNDDVNAAAVAFERRRDGFTITTDPTAFDLDAIHEFLSEKAYWCLGIPRMVLEKAIERSLCFALFEGRRQIGFARVVTDGATFAWLCDVYVVESHRGRGLGDWLIASVLEHPEMQGLRRTVLATRDAHALYRRNGFAALQTPERWMAIANPDVYGRGATAS